MSLLNIILRRQPKTQSNPSEIPSESQFISRERCDEIRQIRDNYYLEQRSFWYR
jgi:hypothetical protein